MAVGLAIHPVPSLAQNTTVFWAPEAFGQNFSNACHDITWPNNINWSESETTALDSCSNLVVTRPSNWSTPGFPNGFTFDVVLGDTGISTSLDLVSVSVNSLTMLPGSQLQFVEQLSGTELIANSFVELEGDVNLVSDDGDPGGTGQIVTPLLWKSAGTNLSEVGPQLLLNGATLQVDSGQMDLEGGGTQSNVNFVVATGAVLSLSPNAAGNTSTPTWFGTMSGTGGGQVVFITGQIAGNPVLDFPPGLFWWTGGGFEAGDNVTNTGAITLSATNSPAIISATLYNAGLFLQTNGGTLNNNGHGIGTFVNLPQGTYQFAGDGADVDVNFTNFGVVEKSSGTGSSVFTELFNNQGGTFQVDSGRVALAGGASSNGTFSVAAGALVDLTGGGGASWSGMMTGSGPGTVLFASGSISGNPLLNFPPGQFLWTGGLFPNGSTPTNIGSMTINSTNGAQIQGGTFYNAGSILHTNGGTLNNNGHDVGTLQNFAQGTYQFVGDGNDVDVIFNNMGLVWKSSGVSSSIFTQNFNNQGGTVQVDSGRVVLAGGTSSNGTFSVAAGALVDLTGGGGASWSGMLAGSGLGTVLFASGSISGNPALNFPPGQFLWTGGLFPNGSTPTNIGSMTINSTSGAQIQGGTFYNAGLIVHTNGGTLNDNGHGVGTLQNFAQGTYQFVGDGANVQVNFNNAGLIRKSSGTGTASFTDSFSSQGGTVEVDSGRVVLAGGANSNGTFSVAAGALVDLTGGGGVSWSGMMTGSGLGTVLFARGSMSGNPLLNFPPGQFMWTGGLFPNGSTPTNIGSMTINSTNGAQIQGGFFYNAGLILHTNGGTLNDNGHGVGTLQNFAQGTYQLVGDGANVQVNFNNAGLIRKSSGTGTASFTDSFSNLGGSVEIDSGSISISGSGYAQGGGTFSVTLSGTNAGQFGQLKNVGAATLGGPLNVTLAGGFSPAVGTQLRIISSSSRSGIFTVLNIPPGLSVNYDGNGALLVVTNVLPVQILSPQLAGTNLTFSFNTFSNQSYTIQQNTNLASTNWMFFTNFIGTGSPFQFETPVGATPQNFFRVLEP